MERELLRITVDGLQSVLHTGRGLRQLAVRMSSDLHPHVLLHSGPSHSTAEGPRSGQSCF